MSLGRVIFSIFPEGWSYQGWSPVRFPYRLIFRSWVLGLILSCGLPPSLFAQDAFPLSSIQRVTVPILGTTLNRHWEQIGVVAEVQIQFERRPDHDGLRVLFQSTPGRFSPRAQQAVQQAIREVVKVGHVDPDSWTITLTLPYQGLTMYGESLSGMVGLCVLALGRGDSLPKGRVLTGTITATGQIGMVGGIPLKIEAAFQRDLHKVIIPEEIDIADGDWNTPFLMVVTPVGTIKKAYRALTDRSLEFPPSTQAISVFAAH
jgi:Lon protease (S16) C-terminal proteolytic domain